MFSPWFQQAFQRLDHAAMAAGGALVRGAGDAYLCARAQVLQGQAGEVARVVALGGAEPAASAMIPLIDAWREVRSGTADERTMDDLASLTRRFPAGDLAAFLRAEAHFLLGFMGNARGELRAALSHHGMAARTYAALGWPASEALALYNQCLAHDGLGERQFLDACLSRMRRAVASCPAVAARLACLRMDVLVALDGEEWELACARADEGLALCRDAGRPEDHAALTCLRQFAIACQDPVRRRDGHEDERAGPWLDDPHTKAFLGELRALRGADPLPPGAVAAMIPRWESAGLGGMHRHMLFHALLKNVAAGNHPGLLLRTARRAIAYAAAHPRALRVADPHYHEILALIRMGDRETAESRLQAYRADALQAPSSARVRKANDLSLMILASPPGPQARKAETLSLDTRNHEASFRGRKIPLAAKPMLEKLLHALLTSRRPRSLAEVFAIVYGGAFHPRLHERRLNSLVDRLRAALGAPEAVVRRAGTLTINPAYRTMVSTPEKDSDGPSERRQALRLYLAQARRPFTISDLARVFPTSRRSLQLDLQLLARADLVKTRGSTRNRSYYVD